MCAGWFEAVPSSDRSKDYAISLLRFRVPEVDLVAQNMRGTKGGGAGRRRGVVDNSTHCVPVDHRGHWSVFELILNTLERKTSIMKIKNRTATALVSSALATVLVVGLGGFGLASASASGTLKKGQTFYLIPKDTLNPYETLEDGGIKAALQALGDKAVISSGTVDTAAAQIPSIQAAIQAHAAG